VLKDGQPVSGASRCAMSRGEARVIESPDATALATLINAAKSHEALTIGLPLGDAR
jgi:hypothetical protein